MTLKFLKHLIFFLKYSHFRRFSQDIKNSYNIISISHILKINQYFYCVGLFYFPLLSSVQATSLLVDFIHFAEFLLLIGSVFLNFPSWCSQSNRIIGQLSALYQLFFPTFLYLLRTPHTDFIARGMTEKLFAFVLASLLDTSNL